MSMNFLDYYRENLNHIRALAAEFASEFPKIAARLELSPLNCQDPYVERLIEGTAFLAARVEKRIDDGFPRMLETLLSSVSPQVLYPVPSAGIAELVPDYGCDGIKSGIPVSVDDRFEARVSPSEQVCVFRPFWETAVFPLSLSGAEYLTRNIDSVCPASKNDAAALKLDFRAEGGAFISDCLPDHLDIFLNMSESDASEIQRQLLVDLNKIYVLGGDGKTEEACGVNVSVPALDGGDTVFGRGGRLRGLGILQEFMAHPRIFKFVRINGLRNIFKKCRGMDAGLVFTFGRRVSEFVLAVNPGSLRLWCVPVINVFRKRSSRERIDGSFEYHVVPERSAPRDYEVYSVEKADFFDEDNNFLFSARPFYSADKDYGSADKSDYFSLHRRERLVGKNSAVRGVYPGSEAYISVSGKNWHKRRDEVAQFSADLLCTNGGLPLLLRSDSPLEAPDIRVLRGARFIGSPDKPAGPLVSDGSASSWEKIAHIMLNLSSVLWQPGGVPAHILKRLVTHYSALPEDETERLADGIISVETEPEIFRFLYKSCSVYYENGWRVKITLSEQKYEGVGFFIFACVLRALLESFSSVNSCVETVLYTEEKGFITKWTTSEN